MARIRTIKPEFFTSEQIVECSTSARLLFVGLWCFSDDGGVHPASIKRLKMEVFPGDALDDGEIESMVNELIEQGLIEEFESQTKKYWQVTGWGHQKIDRPTYRFPQQNSSSPRRALDESSTSTRRALDEPSPPEGKGREGKGKEGKVLPPPTPPASGGGGKEGISKSRRRRRSRRRTHKNPFRD